METSQLPEIVKDMTKKHRTGGSHSRLPLTQKKIIAKGSEEGGRVIAHQPSSQDYASYAAKEKSTVGGLKSAELVLKELDDSQDKV